MSELDDLPEPVRDAMDDLLCSYVAAKKKDIATISAELLRLASRVKELERENAMLTGHGHIQTTWHAPGLGEIHDAEHEYDIGVSKIDREMNDSYVIDDDAAKEICAKLNRLDRAESELAGLKARIAEAPTHVAEWTLAHGLTFNAADGTLDGRRVALFDLEDNAQ